MITFVNRLIILTLLFFVAFFKFFTASAVAQLLEMAQNYQVEHPKNGDGGDEEGNDADDAEGDADAPAKEPGEANDNDDEAPEKDPYEMSGKEAEFKCSCKYNKGKPCFSRYARPELMEFRSQYKALNKKELDIAILSKIQTGMHLSPMTCQKKKAHTERKKVRSDHYFHGDKICRDTFCFIHRISHNKLSVLMAHYRGSGICVRVMKRQAAKEKAAALAKQAKPKRKAKGKAGSGRAPRKRKPKTGASKQGNKRQRISGASGAAAATASGAIDGGNIVQNTHMTVHRNESNDAATAMARHIEAMHQYVDIPIGQMPQRRTMEASDKRYMNVSSRMTETTTASQSSHHPHAMHHLAAASSQGMSNAASGRPDTVEQNQHHHGVWHLPRRPDMQHEGPYLLPL